MQLGHLNFFQHEAYRYRVQDAAIAILALRKADEKKMGVKIDVGFD